MADKITDLDAWKKANKDRIAVEKQSPSDTSGLNAAGLEEYNSVLDELVNALQLLTEERRSLEKLHADPVYQGHLHTLIERVTHMMTKVPQSKKTHDSLQELETALIEAIEVFDTALEENEPSPRPTHPRVVGTTDNTADSSTPFREMCDEMQFKLHDLEEALAIALDQEDDAS